MDAPIPAASFALDLVVKFLDGRGRLGLRAPLSIEPAVVEELELEVPNLRFPFDLSGGAARFQNRRCRLREARITIEQQGLRRWLQSRRLEDYGIEALTLRIADGQVSIGFRARVGETRVHATAIARVEAAGPRRVRVHIARLRLYGWLSVPAVQIGAAILQAIAGPPVGEGPRGTAAPTRSALEIDPLDLVLWRALVPMGFRLPSQTGAKISGLQADAGRIEVSFSDGDGLVEQRDLGGRPSGADGDLALVANDVDAALEAYRAEWLAAPTPGLFDRMVDVLVASPARWDEALGFIKAAGGVGERPAAQLALAAIEAERGDQAKAAERYTGLAAEARIAGEIEDEIAALLRAAELFVIVAPPRSTALLERVLQIDPEHAGAERALSERYGREARWADLARLESARIRVTDDSEAQATAHARLAEVLLEHLGQPSRAREELERAVRLNTYDPLVWGLLGRAYAATGERDRALGAFDCVVALSSERAVRADAHVRAAKLLADDSAPDTAAALARFQAALTIDPRNAAALAGEADLYTRTGRHEDAAQVFERAFASIDPGPDSHAERRRLLCEEADRLLARGLREDARRALERALEYGDDRELLRKVAALAEQDGRHVDAEAALARLIALGEADAPLRRAQALLALGDAVGARAAAQALFAAAPGEVGAPLTTAEYDEPDTESRVEMAIAVPGAPATRADQVATARVVVAACRALGDIPGLRAALERLLEQHEDPAARVEAASLAISAAEVELAERHLAAAGEHRAALELRVELLEARGDDAALDETLSRLIRLLGMDPSARARALVRQGALRARRDRNAEALDCYRSAVALLADSSDEEADVARAGLGRAAYLLGRWDEARAAWEPLHLRAVAPRAQRALRLGEIALRQRDAVAAASFYRSALDLPLSGPDASRCYEALVALSDGRGDISGAVRALLDAASDPRTRESDQVRAGRLAGAAGRLLQQDDKDGAVTLLERALALDPAHQGALDGLESLAVQAGDDRRLADALERRIASPRTRPDDRKRLLGRLAQLEAEKLGRRDAALATHLRLLELDPASRSSLLFLADEALRAGDHVEEERHLASLAGLQGERMAPAIEADLHARLADRHARGGRHDDAEIEARRALAIAPRQAVALGVLDDILTRGNRLGELESILALRAEVETGFERALDYDYRRAGLLEGLGRRDDALAVYDRIVRVRPSAAAAWERLAALHRAAQSWKELLEVLGRLAARHAAAGEPQEAAALCVEMAHLAQDRQGDTQVARRCLERALVWDTRCTLAIDGLLAIARAAGDAPAEDALLGRRMDVEEDPQRREALLVERAQARRDRGNLDGAAVLIAAAPSARAGTSLLTLRAELSSLRGQPAKASDDLSLLARRAREAGDLDREREILRRLVRLGPAGRVAANEDLVRRAVELDADDIDAAAAVVEIARGRADPRALLADLEILRSALRRGPSDPAREVALCVEVAQLARTCGDLDLAALRLREAITLAPDAAHLTLLYGELLIARGELDAAVRILEQAAGHGASPAVHALLANAYERRGNTDKAAAAFDAAGEPADPARGGGVDDLRALALLLSARGEHAKAAAPLAETLAEAPTPMLTRALEAAGRHADLVDLLERRASDAPAPEARKALLEAAAICEHVLDDAWRAAALIERALPLGVADANLWLRLGRIYAGPLQDQERAASCYADAHAIDPDRADVLLALADVYLDRREVARAEQTLRYALGLAAADLDEESRRRDSARAHLRLADIAEGSGHGATLEAELHAAGGEGAVSAWQRLASYYRSVGDEARQAAALWAWAECEPGQRAEILRSLRPLVAGDDSARIDHELTRIDPSDESARMRVLARLRAEGDAGALARGLLDEIGRVAQSERAALYLELGETHERLGDARAALDAMGQALSERGSLEAAALVVASGRRLSRGSEAARIVESAFPGEPAAAALLIAEAWLSPGGDAERARPLLSALVEHARGAATPALAPGQRLALRSLLRSAGRWADLIAELDAAAAASDGPATALSLEAAEIVEDQVGDLAEAAARFERAFELDPTQAEVGAHARELYLLVGDLVSALAMLDKEVAAADAGEASILLALRPALAARTRGALPSRTNQDELPSAERAGGTDASRAVPAAAASPQPPSLSQAAPASRERLSATDTGARRSVAGPPALLGESAIRRDDPHALYAALKAQLDRIPRDAVARITDLRQRLGDVARRVKDDDAARGYYELVLSQHPEAPEALRPLVELYAAVADWERCAEVLGRLAYLAATPSERAEYTFRQAEVYRVRLGDTDRANAGYLRAADYLPEHAGSLRRLIPYYLGEGDVPALVEVVGELERQRVSLGDVAVEAGFGLAMNGEESRAAPLLVGVDAARLAEAIGTFGARAEPQVDAALRASARTLSGTLGKGTASDDTPTDLSDLRRALEAILARDPARVGARAVAARLAERTNDVARARVHLAVLAWIDPESAAARRLDDLPPPAVSYADESLEPPPTGPLARAMRLLGPLTIGVGAPMPGAVPHAAWGERLSILGERFGFPVVTAALVDEQADPVWPEPTAPPRLLIRRDLASDEEAVYFAAARALCLLRAGVPVVEQQPEEDLASLLTAAAALFDPSVSAGGPLVLAWLAALRALPTPLESLPAGARAALRTALGEAARPGVAATGVAFCQEQRRAADRVAFNCMGSLGAGLRALAPELSAASSYEKGNELRARGLAQPGPLRALVSHALSDEGLRRLRGLG